MSRTNKDKPNIPRNGSAINAKRRKSGKIKDKRDAKKGAKNKQAEILKEENE